MLIRWRPCQLWFGMFCRSSSTRRDEDLLLAPVEHVAVDVEVVDRQAGLRAAVDLEPREHLGRVEQPDVLQRCRVAGHRRRVERSERRRQAHDVVEVDAHRGARRLDVALDVRLLAGLLVRVDDERLDEGRVQVATGDEDDQPQHRRDERQPPRRPPDRREVQPGGQQGHEHEQHERRQLGVDDGVRGALDEAAPLVRRLVARHPVVGGLQRGEHREQHGDVALRGRPHGRHGRREHDAAVEDVGEQGHHEHEDHGDEQPVEHEAEERQLEHVEPDVGVELRIVAAEGLAVAEQQPGLPLRRRRQGDHQRQHGRAEVAEQAQAVPEQLVEPLDVGMHVRREVRRREAVGDQQVDPGQHGERAEEQHEQGELGADDTPEHVGPAEPVVPQEVDVEAGQRPSEHDDEQEDDAGGDEDDAARDPSPPPLGEVGGTPHGRER